ncbi:MAG: NAD(P)/FAD-dependent oxidoreductase [Woeseiaceae bacterium]
MKPQKHTNSYYAATANSLTNFAQLSGEQTTDICVIGAGFTGVSTALHLAERGYDVHVVEANRVGWGASGRNGGQLIGEANAAVSLGATVCEHSPVLRIEHGDRPTVVTNNGSVTANAVIIAGNAYHFLERKLRGIMFPVNSFIVATEPLSEDLVTAINPVDLAVCDPNFVLQYFRLSADKRMLFGARINYFGDDPAVIRKSHRKKMARLYPQLAGVRIDYAWGGKIGVPINRVPQLGRLSGNVFYCQGYSGHGVNVTHLAGRIMADAVAGTMEKFDLFAQVPPFVVPGAHTLAKPLVSLGMMYYRIRDRL